MNTFSTTSTTISASTPPAPRGRGRTPRSTIKPSGPRSKKIRQSRFEIERENNLRAIDEMARRDVELLRTFFAGARVPENPFPEGARGADVMTEEFKVEFRGDDAPKETP